MNDGKNMDLLEPGEGLTPEEEEELERERKRQEEERLAPYKEASAQRKSSAEIVAEHDDLLAEVLFELTLKEMEG